MCIWSMSVRTRNIFSSIPFFLFCCTVSERTIIVARCVGSLCSMLFGRGRLHIGKWLFRRHTRWTVWWVLCCRKWEASTHIPAALHLGEELLGIPRIGICVGARAGLDVLQKGKTHSLPGIETWIAQFLAETLYQLRFSVIGIEVLCTNHMNYSRHWLSVSGLDCQRQKHNNYYQYGCMFQLA
jgi:hypothetical protein